MIRNTPRIVPKKIIITQPKKTYGLKKALLVGINYIGSRYELSGSINDINNIENILKKKFPMCKDYKTITDNTELKPTKKNILESIDWLVNSLQPGENVYFHYSGHGGLIKDTNGDEVSGMDSCIFAYNNGKIEEIVDDEIRMYLANRIPVGCKCFVTFDCCNSGTVCDLRYTYNNINNNTLSFSEDKMYEKTNGQIIFLSACSDNQAAKEEKSSGAFTNALIHTWNTYGVDIKLKYLLWDIGQYLLENGYRQTPQLSSGQYQDLNSIFDLSV